MGDGAQYAKVILYYGYNNLMENPTSSVEKVLVPYQESIDSAAKLIEDNKEKLDAAIMECYGQTDMARCIRKIPETIACAYSGHGITKGTYLTHLAMFLNIISNSSIKGDYGKLSGGGYTAWTNSDFFILSHYNQDLGIRDSAGNLLKNEVGFVANVGAFVVGNKYYPIIDDLRRMFPNKNIIKAEEVPNFVSSEVGSFT